MNLLKIEFELNWWSLEKMISQLEISFENINQINVEIWGEWD